MTTSVKLTAAIITVAAEPVDVFTWLRDFHGRPRDTVDMRPQINAAAHAVACAIAAYTNGKTGEAQLGIRRIADAAQVSTSTALGAIKAVEAAGWVQITRATRAGTQANATSTYALTSPIAATRTAMQAVADMLTEGVYRESVQSPASLRRQGGYPRPLSPHRETVPTMTSTTIAWGRRTAENRPVTEAVQIALDTIRAIIDDPMTGTPTLRQHLAVCARLLRRARTEDRDDLVLSDQEAAAVTAVVGMARDYMLNAGFADDETYPDDAWAARVLRDQGPLVWPNRH